MQQYDEAIADYTKAIQINPNNDYAYYNRGFIYKNNFNDYKKAIEDFTKYIQFDSKFMWVYVNRGNCYKALGQKKEAEADFAKARELGYKG